MIRQIAAAGKIGLMLCLPSLTSCDPHWGGSAINQELDKAEVLGCYSAADAKPTLRVTETNILADQTVIYSRYTYARLGKNNYPALVVEPRMAMRIQQENPRIYSFSPFTKGTGKDFNYPVSDTSLGKAIHLALDDGQVVTFVRGDCQS